MPYTHGRPPKPGDGLHGPGRDEQPIIFRDEQTIKLNGGGHCLFHSLQRPQKRTVCIDMETMTFNQMRYADYREDEIAVTLRSSFGDYGGVVKCLCLKAIRTTQRRKTRKSAPRSRQAWV